MDLEKSDVISRVDISYISNEEVMVLQVNETRTTLNTTWRSMGHETSLDWPSLLHVLQHE